MMKTSAMFLMALTIACKTAKEQPVAVAQQEEPKAAAAEQQAVDAAQTDGPVETLIIGEWDWVKTVCCGRVPATETPETLGMKKSMNFQKGGKAEFRWADRTSSQTYETGYDRTNNNRPFIIIGGGKPGLVFMKDDTLMIDYGYMDLQTEYYVRKK